MVEQELDENMFLVEVNVSKSNVISIYLDSMEGVSIDQCVTISRKIESHLDREEEDFELMVSSAGLGQPFKVIRQYSKNTGKDIEVVTHDGIKLRGILTAVDENGIRLKTTKVIVGANKEKRKLVEEHKLGFEKIKSAKTIISF